mmetsp:Transcript_14499/g.20672  ORF Transcript_14499/g.20672 Transcript_14499/m.20672 type:complete len:105 (+) Transcript_14499:52-366(+)
MVSTIMEKHCEQTEPKENKTEKIQQDIQETLQFLDRPESLTPWTENEKLMNQKEDESPVWLTHQEVASLQPTSGSSSDHNLSYTTPTTNIEQVIPKVIQTTNLR